MSDKVLDYLKSKNGQSKNLLEAISILVKYVVRKEKRINELEYELKIQRSERCNLSKDYGIALGQVDELKHLLTKVAKTSHKCKELFDWHCSNSSGKTESHRRHNMSKEEYFNLTEQAKAYESKQWTDSDDISMWAVPTDEGYSIME